MSCSRSIERSGCAECRRAGVACHARQRDVTCRLRYACRSRTAVPADSPYAEGAVPPMTGQLARHAQGIRPNALDEASVRIPIPLSHVRAVAGQRLAMPVMLEANAMVLATVDQHGMPSARTVLLKGFDNGLVFYTNYESRKGRDIAANPAVALVFNWPSLERQVRITGTATQVIAAESDAYFASPAQWAARSARLASPQSEPVPTARGWKRGSHRFGGAVTSRSSGPETGADIACPRGCSSFGRDGPTGCMIGLRYDRP